MIHSRWRRRFFFEPNFEHRKLILPVFREEEPLVLPTNTSSGLELLLLLAFPKVLVKLQAAVCYFQNFPYDSYANFECKGVGTQCFKLTINVSFLKKVLYDVFLLSLFVQFSIQLFSSFCFVKFCPTFHFVQFLSNFSILFISNFWNKLFTSGKVIKWDFLIEFQTLCSTISVSPFFIALSVSNVYWKLTLLLDQNCKEGQQ